MSRRARPTARIRADRPTPAPVVWGGSAWPTRGQVGVALLALSGILVLPGLAEPFLMPKATLAAVGAALVLTVPRQTGLSRTIAWVIAAGAVTLAVAAAQSTSPWVAVWGRYPRFEGVWVLPVYTGALVAGARMRAWPAVHRALPRVLTPAAVLVVLVAGLQAAGPAESRVTSLLGNASELGTWAVIVAVYLAGLAAAGDRIAAVGAGAAGLAVVLSGSRGALGALLVGLLILALARWRASGSRRATLAVAGAAGLVVLLAVMLPATRARLLGDTPLAWSTVNGRRWLWSDTLDLVAAHPLLGVGPSGFVDAVGAHHSLGWAAQVGSANPPDSAHNLILQALAAGGILIAGLLLALGVVWGLQAVRSLRTDPQPTAAAGSAVIAGATALMVHFTSAATLPLLCLLAGWVTATVLPERAGAAERMARWVPAAGLSCCALGLATATAAEAPIAAALHAATHADLRAAQRAWATAHRMRPWDTDLWLRHATAATNAAAQGLLPAASCLPPTWHAHTRLPTSSEAAHTRAECLEANNDLTAARAVLATALKHDPTNLDLLLLAGVLAARDGDPDAAEALLMRAAELAPTEPAPWTNLAVLYQQAGRTAEAAAAQQRAHQLNQ